MLYQSTGKQKQADTHYTEALPLLENALGKEHPTVALALANFATLRLEQEKSAEAKKLCARALAIYEKTLGPKHPDTRGCAAALKAISK